MTNKKEYTPHKRDFLENSSKKDKVEDDIVCNNISNVEFDYTYNCGDDVLYDCCNNNHSNHHNCECNHEHKEEKHNHNCGCKHNNKKNNCECR